MLSPTSVSIPWWESRRAAAVACAVFYLVLVASVWNKGVTYDEPRHATAGYSYWKFGDYRLDPEIGVLANRVLALPLLLCDQPFPSLDSEAWKGAEEKRMGDLWFNQPGADGVTLLRVGRFVSALFAVALGGLVWGWARRFGGAVAGSLALVLYVLNPTVLANGALMTSDILISALFLTSIMLLWDLMQEITPRRLLLSALSAAALFTVKNSALTLVPVAAVLVALRLGASEPIAWKIFGREGSVTPRARRAVCLLALAVFHVAVGWVGMWGLYGFRFSAFGPDQVTKGFSVTWEETLGTPPPSELVPRLQLTTAQAERIATLELSRALQAKEWTSESADALSKLRSEMLSPTQIKVLDKNSTAPSATLAQCTLVFFRQHRLLPEAYLYGLSQTFLYAQGYPAFLNGAVSQTGWRTFFPYTFLVKTPLVTLALIAAALVIGVGLGKTHRADFYRMAPLAVFVVVYVAICCLSNLNIGHRHLLPIYAPLFIFVAVIFSRQLAAAPGRAIPRRGLATALVALLGLQAVEVLARFPNYLAYFNGIVAPDQGYWHLVDSSLDWGQELPAVARFLAHEPKETRSYLAYFGLDRPAKYGIAATPLFSLPGYDVKDEFLQGQRVPALTTATEMEPILKQFPEYDVAGVSRDGNFQDLLFLRQSIALQLHAGTYVIGATLLQPVYYRPWSGKWTAAYEAEYQTLRAEFAPYLRVTESRAERLRLLGQSNLAALRDGWRKYREIRFARLTAYLRQREPDAEINFAMLVYRLTDADLAQALEGPAPIAAR